MGKSSPLWCLENLVSPLARSGVTRYSVLSYSECFRSIRYTHDVCYHCPTATLTNSELRVEFIHERGCDLSRSWSGDVISKISLGLSSFLSSASRVQLPRSCQNNPSMVNTQHVNVRGTPYYAYKIIFSIWAPATLSF